MKRALFIIISLLLVTITLDAQTQHGYVKTKGRLASNGTVIAGTRISGATIQVKGRTTVLSQSNGTFSFPVPAQDFYLQNVQKQGFVIMDPEMLTREYTYSKSPLVLVLETKEQQADDKLATKKKIRGTLQQQLQEKEEEIESLKAQQKLSNEEYRKQLQELYDQQESNERLINEMVNRFSKTDFDIVDDFNRRIAQLILDGKLTKADSLLNTKGDIQTAVNAYNQIHLANIQEERNQELRQQRLNKSIAYERQVKEDLIQRCKGKIDIFQLQHKKDSTLHYLRIIVGIDTLNMDWRFHLYNYQQEYFGDTQGALEGYEKCRVLLETSQHDSANIARCYDALGMICHQQGKDSLAFSYMEKALNIRQGLYKDEQEEVAVSYSNIGTLYNDQGNIYKALESYQKALLIRKHIYKEDTIQHSIATIYNNLGKIYRQKNELDNALSCYQHVCDIKQSLLPGKFHRSMARCYNNMAIVYMAKNDYEASLRYLKEALVISDSVYGRQHILTANILYNIGNSYASKKAYSQAIAAFSQSLVVFEELQAANISNKKYEQNLTECCLCLGVSFLQVKDYYKAKEFFEKAKEYDSKRKYANFIEEQIKRIH